MTPNQISGIPDPHKRAVEAQGFIVRARDAIAEVEGIRDDAITAMLAEGWSVRKVASALKISPARVQQIRPQPAPRKRG